MTEELFQTKLQLCTMLANVGQLQVQVAQLQAEKLKREYADFLNSQKESDDAESQST